MQFCCCNLSPRGDGNFFGMAFSIVSALTPLQFIPARGRKLVPKSSYRSDIKLQFIPARGRKLHCLLCISLSASIGCNLSPRGDGNPASFRNGDNLHVVAIYPREGTETVQFSRFLALASVAIYPREGTETNLELLTPASSGAVAIYPREGTETCCCMRQHGRLSVAIYPREGTETSPRQCIHTFA